MNIKSMAISTVTLCMVAVSTVCGKGNGRWGDLETFLLFSPEPGDSAKKVDWETFAQARGIAKEELAEKMAEIARNGLWNNSDDSKRLLAEGALWELAKVGGENEYAFVHDIMHKHEAKYRRIAMNVLFHMVPEKWEDLVREIALDEKYGDYDRFLAYEEAFRIGRDGDLDTRNSVIKVLKEMRVADTSQGNRNSLGLWLTELEGEGWEEWMRQVVSEEGFYNADRYGAYELAFRVGRDGDEKTRQHVLDVLEEMKGKEIERSIKNMLGLWIEELKSR